MLATIRSITRTMSTKINEKHLVAVCQMTTQHDLQYNFDTCRGMVERARERKCKMVFFPECFDFIGRSKEENIQLAMSDDCEYVSRFRDLAKNNNLWLSLGGLHRSGGSEHPWNTHLIIDNQGKTRAKYDKLHLFDLDIPGKVRLMESEFSQEGASVLLRARAIENQCYVVAAAQTGKHNDKRMSYGHSMIVDPWGAIVAQCSERVDMAFAEIDLGYVNEIREMQPVFSHRRSNAVNFSEYSITPGAIFYRSGHCFAFVNLKPVLSGHVLISTKKIHKRLTDLSDEETADLFVTAKKIQKMIEKHYGVSSSTVCIQDGPDAGQTVSHVHVHILPRKAGDFGPNPDSLYQHLETHDKNPEVKPRTLEEMHAEATVYRQAISKM